MSDQIFTELETKWSVFPDNPLIGCLSVELDEHGEEAQVTITPPNIEQANLHHYQPIVRAFLSKQSLKDLADGAEMEGLGFTIDSPLYAMSHDPSPSNSTDAADAVYPAMHVFGPIREVVKTLRQEGLLSEDETRHAYQQLGIVPAALGQSRQHGVSAGSHALG